MNNKMKDLFGVSEAQLRTLVAEGLRGGGDWCDLFFEHTVFVDLLLRDGKVGSGGYHIDYGCGIRVLKGEKTGYAYAESTDMNALLSAARAASCIAAAGGTGSVNVGTAPQYCGDCGDWYPYATDWESFEPSTAVPYLERLEAEIRKRDSRVLKVVAMLSSSMSRIMMYNSLDELSCDERPMCNLTASVVFGQGGQIENKRVSHSLMMGPEMLTDEVLEDLAAKAVEGMDARFEARRSKGGKMSVVMGAGASGILLHEAMGHAFEADFNRKGTSIFSDKMGARICRPGINIIDDGTVPHSRGAVRYDDEGVPGQKTYMVEDGRLNSYLHDRISAAWYGVAPTGNGRRESFRYNPIPRMRATYMESGSDGTVQDLIAMVKQGIYVDQFANGQVKIGEGDFTFYVKSGYLIEGGRLTMPVKDVNIIGNGPQALADIQAVAADLKIDEGCWTCGKEQSVPVACGIPSVLIGGLTVGGE